MGKMLSLSLSFAAIIGCTPNKKSDSPNPNAAQVSCLSQGDGFAFSEGICHSKASLFAREFGFGPVGPSNLEYCETLKRCGVVASEMEASTLFVLSAVAGGDPRPLDREAGTSGCQAGAVLAVYAMDDSNMKMDPAVASRAEQRAIRVALEGVRAWAEKDRASSF